MLLLLTLSFNIFLIERKEGEGISDRHRCWKWAINSLKTGGFIITGSVVVPINKVQLSQQFLCNIPWF